MLCHCSTDCFAHLFNQKVLHETKLGNAKTAVLMLGSECSQLLPSGESNKIILAVFMALITSN